MARRVGGSADADDVVQEVLVRLHRGASLLRDGERFGAWAHRIAEHAVADHLRARARHPIPVDESTLGAATAGVDDAEPPLQAELSECMAVFLSRLGAPYREAITLTELQGVTQVEAAEMQGVSLSGMKSRVQRGRARIRRMFEDCCELELGARGRVVECTPRARATPHQSGHGCG